MKTRFKTSTKSQKQESILENRNFLNNQNYVLGFDEKKWLLKNIVENNGKTLIPGILKTIFTLSLVILYYGYGNEIYFFIVNIINKIFSGYIGVFFMIFIPGLVLIFIYIIIFLFKFFNNNIRLNHYINRKKVTIYKKTINKPILENIEKIRENQVFWGNLEKINESYFIETKIPKLNTGKDLFTKNKDIQNLYRNTYIQ